MDNAKKPDFTPLRLTMIRKGMSRADILEVTGLAPSTFTKINAGEWVALEVISRLCAALDCDVADVLTFRPERETSR
jgi:DNA-binding Xre family transcriptional regulator